MNVYAYCESQLDADDKHEALSPRDPRRKPLSDMLLYAWERYRRPMIIGETSGSRDGRADWLRMVMQESLVALNSGIDLQGICLFPCIDMPDWNTGKLAEIGIYDLRDLEGCERVPCDPYIEELRRWQDILNHPASTSSDSLRAHGMDTVQLSEVRDCARRWGQKHPHRRAHEPARQAA